MFFQVAFLGVFFLSCPTTLPFWRLGSSLLAGFSGCFSSGVAVADLPPFFVLNRNPTSLVSPAVDVLSACLHFSFPFWRELGRVDPRGIPFHIYCSLTFLSPE